MADEKQIGKVLQGIPNPFGDTVVADPWQANAGDIPEIHGEAYRLCLRLLDEVRREGKTRSVVLYGEAGSGKSHLLRRLRAAWMGEPPHDVDPIRPEVVFVAVKLQTSPRHLWRYLRRSLVDDLLRKDSEGTSQLHRILLRRLGEIRKADADLRLWFEWLRESHPDTRDFQATLSDLFDQVDETARLGRDHMTILEHVLLDRHHRNARAWLRGDSLPGSALDALGVSQPDEESDPEEQARETVSALCRLAGRRIPVVFCFDQIESLQQDRDDTAALFAFGRVVMELFEQTSNAFLISCVQISFIEQLKSAMIRPAWDRLAMNLGVINPLRWEEASRLIAARLNTPPELNRLRASRPNEPFWPLDTARLKLRVGDGQPARRILSDCSRLFEAVQAGRSPDLEPIAPDLVMAWRKRLKACADAYEATRTGEVLDHGLPLLFKAVGPSWRREFGRELPDIHQIWRGPDGRVGIHFCESTDMRAVWRPLGRLRDHLRQGQIEKLVLIRDESLPFHGKAVLANRADLLAEGAQEVRPGRETVAALDALRGLLSDAGAGDLTVDGRSIEATTVAEWLAANLPDSLRRFVEEIFSYPGVGGGESLDDLPRRLAALLDDRPIIPLDVAANDLGVEPDRLEALVRSEGSTIGWIEGPPDVLFRMIQEALHPLEAPVRA